MLTSVLLKSALKTKSVPISNFTKIQLKHVNHAKVVGYKTQPALNTFRSFHSQRKSFDNSTILHRHGDHSLGSMYQGTPGTLFNFHSQILKANL
jgi:hypothetical protein